MRDILKMKTFDGEIVIKKSPIGYSVYDCGSFLGWRLIMSSAKRLGKYLSGKL